MKLYTEEQLVNTIEAIRDYLKNYPEKFHESMIEKHLKNLAPIELPSDEEIEEKLNVAYGNGYEQGEMDFYKKMQEKGNEYSEGYKEGYKRALDYMSDAIKNKIEIKENGSNISTTANTTGTTFLCTEFVSDQLFYKGTLPHCMRCGKPQYQHPIISNTI